ncbi:MAG: hypothetical protein ACUVQW_00550 [Candidatus Bathycorpusculaceae bacterium]
MSGPWGSGKTTLLNIIGGKNLGVKDEDFGKFPLSQSWLCLPTLQSRFNPILEIAGWLLTALAPFGDYGLNLRNPKKGEISL